MEIPYRTRGESRILGVFFQHKQTLRNVTRILGLYSSILSCDVENGLRKQESPPLLEGFEIQ